MIAHVERDESALSRNVLESLPQSLYRSLPWPANTIDACVEIVGEAVRTKNPRRVRAWIEREQRMAGEQELLGCLDGVLHQMIRPGVGFADRVRFANTIRKDAADYLSLTNATSHGASLLDPNAGVLADGILVALRLHDPDLADHAEATSEFAKRLAFHIGADPETIARAALAGRLHDIGKMRISRSIVRKPMPLTTAERAEVQLYPASGGDMLAAMPALAKIAPIVAAHRERVDGGGFPHGLRGDDIPLESRIVAIADAFHTMTLARPHRKARTQNEAIAELLAHAGAQFDAQLVDAFATMLGRRLRIARSA